MASSVTCGEWPARIWAEGVRGVVLHAGKDVLVGHHRDRRVGVTEPFGHDLDGHAVSQQQGGVGVAEVVEPDR